MSLTNEFHNTKFMTIVERHFPPGHPGKCQGLVYADISVKEVRGLDEGLVGICNECGDQVAFSTKRIAKEVESTARQMRSEMNDLFDYARELRVQAFTERARGLVEEIKNVEPDGQAWAAEYQLVRLAEDVARTIRHLDERQYGNMG